MEEGGVAGPIGSPTPGQFNTTAILDAFRETEAARDHMEQLAKGVPLPGKSEEEVIKRWVDAHGRMEQVLHSEGLL
jgi:hypothetical protein